MIQAKQKEIDSTKTALQGILEQQKQLVAQASSITKDTELITPEIQALLDAIQPPPAEVHREEQKTAQTQQQLMDQLRAALTTKSTPASGDWQKDILRQFLIQSNKTPTTGGAMRLKPELLKRQMNEHDEFAMADWLAHLNREEAGEWLCDDSDECKHKKVKSGMLDKTTTNIVHKEVWPQKNLLEDWADEEMEFRQLQFKHHIAGEIRTIETCTEPAQILGRLRLLRRMAYAKLRGYDWPLIWKMYAAIPRSIKAKEYTWSDNFDRFETILYSKKQTQTRGGGHWVDRDRDRDTKKWFCRDWNKQEGCSKSTPYRAWFGTDTMQ